ncbi:3-oxoacid CoA-transferase subunit B [Clostridium intestinale]|jgi:acetate CoA/acetoacetate CoA-transferase beta subunit|uniref:3-oxoacid CoA-transferase subunit B n=1 Tax=Clostridium intestinale TaxID=36845 RepID=A0A7D6VNZ1_9CLOT|nr:3-oxoacid CoA-transferase subunit B [Clostridium intestinale]QLY79367.1 3-oxoacid CoA-transferase subunit B [Clostridium intestinale]
MEKRELIAKRVAQEFRDGNVVNLGIGIPTLAANYITNDIQVVLQSENGILGLGPESNEDTIDESIVDAGGKPKTIVQGGAFFDSAFSFSLIRGGHVDITVLGALEVDEEGNLSNWMIPNKKVPGMGGAMDLVVGAKKTIIAMEHVNRDGKPKILEKCVLPLTAAKQVNKIITDLSVIDVVKGEGLVLREIAEGITIEELKSLTHAKFNIAKDLKIIAL